MNTNPSNMDDCPSGTTPPLEDAAQHVTPQDAARQDATIAATDNGGAGVVGGAAAHHRPWGYFLVLEDACNHKIKRIVVRPGKRLSLQRHKYRWEHWVVLAGSALVTLGEKTLHLAPGETIDIPAGQTHRLENTGAVDMELVEVQRGEYCGEDDIERFEDDFGRC